MGPCCDMTKAMKEVGASNTVPSEIFWFVVNQFIRLDPSDVATVKAQASSYKLEDVMASLQKMWGGESLAEKDQEKKRQYRAVLGALSWRGTQSAPWICASVSYLQGAFTTASVGDLCHLSKLVRLQRRFSEDPLVFPAGIGEPMLVTFCDASWASRKDGSSQGGMLTVLANSSILGGDLLLLWPGRVGNFPESLGPRLRLRFRRFRWPVQARTPMSS